MHSARVLFGVSCARFTVKLSPCPNPNPMQGPARAHRRVRVPSWVTDLGLIKERVYPPLPAAYMSRARTRAEQAASN
ncbi:unnamed protein product [Peniophora sp. CBMAI 1063]|nr:unnamed protein product [Peniophora sp. CBMAI 1063]